MARELFETLVFEMGFFSVILEDDRTRSIPCYEASPR